MTSPQRFGYGSVAGSLAGTGVANDSKRSSLCSNRQDSSDSVKLAQALRAPFPSSVGFLIAASACLLHILPNTLLLVSHCWHHGCLEPGCNRNATLNAGRCFPCYSDAIIDYTENDKIDDPSSRHRNWLAVLAACIRAPVVFLFFSYAHRRLVTNLSGPSAAKVDGDFRIYVFELVALTIAVLDVMVVFVPNEGESQIWHVVVCTSVMVLWTAFAIPLFSSVMTATTSKSSWGNLIWAMWFASAAMGVFLAAAWNAADSVVWYFVEWTYILLQGFLILVIGLVLWRHEAALRPKFVK